MRGTPNFYPPPRHRGFAGRRRLTMTFISTDLPCTQSPLRCRQLGRYVAHNSLRRDCARRSTINCESIQTNIRTSVPCTNCTAFGIECRIPTPKRKKTASGKKEGEAYVGCNMLSPQTLTLHIATAMANTKTPCRLELPLHRLTTLWPIVQLCYRP